MSPSSISHYQIVRKLAEGGMGEVYLGRDPRLGRNVAIKTLPAGMALDPVRRRRLEEEARSVSALNHPNIVTVYDIVSTDDGYYLILELVDGEPLDEILERGPLRLEQALDCGAQIAGAVAAAHAAGIVHRDLKPGNVMITGEGRVKVLDFGLASYEAGRQRNSASDASDEDRTHTIAREVSGTAAYMSPEQAEGRRADARSDIFSFGSLLYEMIAGRKAFEGSTPMAQIAAVIRDEPVPLPDLTPDIPPELWRLIRRCLRKQPERRWQNMGDLKVALEELREDLLSGRLSKPAPSAAPASVRRNWIAWGLAGVLVLLVAAIGFLLAPRRPPVVPVEQPLTTFPGVEIAPSFSPDGTQVAFAWNGETEGTFQIYVQVVGSNEPLKLTDGEDAHLSPAWSPDGKTIAFLKKRSAGPNSIMLIPALGGPEREIAEVYVPATFYSASSVLSWHPGGRYLAVVDRSRPGEPFQIALIDLQSGEKRVLLNCPDRFLGDLAPAFSPDGKRIAIARFLSPGSSEILVVPLSEKLEPAAEPLRLTQEDEMHSSPAWTADGRFVVYTSGNSGSARVWITPANGDGRPRPARGVPPGAAYPTVARSGERLAYARVSSDVNLLSFALDGPDESPGTRFLSSTLYDGGPQFSPDGARIAFESNRGGSMEIWIAEADGRNAMPLTTTRGTLAGHARWSPDGSQIAYEARVDGQIEIFTISARGGRPVRITSDPANDTSPTWSADGKSIYFASNRDGRSRVYRIAADGTGAPQTVTETVSSGGYESPDGKYFYFARLGGASTAGIWRKPLEGGEEVRMTEAAVAWQNLSLAANGLYYLPGLRNIESTLYFFDFSTGKTRMVRSLPGAYFFGGFTVSPDRKRIILTRAERLDADLVVVDQFVGEGRGGRGR